MNWGKGDYNQEKEKTSGPQFMRFLFSVYRCVELFWFNSLLGSKDRSGWYLSFKTRVGLQLVSGDQWQPKLMILGNFISHLFTWVLLTIKKTLSLKPRSHWVFQWASRVSVYLPADFCWPWLVLALKSALVTFLSGLSFITSGPHLHQSRRLSQDGKCSHPLSSKLM